MRSRPRRFPHRFLHPSRLTTSPIWRSRVSLTTTRIWPRRWRALTLLAGALLAQAGMPSRHRADDRAPMLWLGLLLATVATAGSHRRVLVGAFALSTVRACQEAPGLAHARHGGGHACCTWWAWAGPALNRQRVVAARHRAVVALFVMNLLLSLIAGNRRTAAMTCRTPHRAGDTRLSPGRRTLTLVMRTAPPAHSCRLAYHFA